MGVDKKIGIIAGNGHFPLIAVREAKKEGYQVHTCAIKGETDPQVTEASDESEWIKLGQLKKLASFFKQHDIRDCLMAGKITKTNIFKGDLLPDLEMVKVFAKTRDRKDDTLLGAIAGYLDTEGIHLGDSTLFIRKFLAKEGVLSQKKPTQEQLEDVAFGWRLAKEMGRLDIGQSVVVKNKSIFAVEAIEGTDQAILRGGELSGGGAVVVKVAKPHQDMRFDVPAVGLGTLDALITSRAKVLAVEAEKTIILDYDSFFDRINKEKIVFIGKLSP